ncbi:MAG: hypothetical protein MUF04_08540 [Akkermansiaceae bacterium]|nr:hypothetical protein [Akkermansiaceae bacterium]
MACGLAWALAACGGGPEWRVVADAPPAGTAPVDQLRVAGNACGPAALLNSYRFGAPEWHRAMAVIRGETDRGRLNTVIRTWGLRPSESLPDRPRWSRHGINPDDLCAVANEINRHAALPELRCEVLLAQPGESPQQLLARVHQRLGKSLANGFPPVVSIRRLALRQEPGKPPDWVVVQGHFVTLAAIQGKLPREATGFAVSYIDPWGARQAEGRIRMAERAFETGAGIPSPCLETVLPGTDAGLQHIRKGEITELTLATGIGKW